MKNKNIEFTKDLTSEYSALIKAENRKQVLRNGIIITILSISLIIGIINLVLSNKALSQTKEINDYTKSEEKIYQTLVVKYSDNQFINFDNINNVTEPYQKIITIKNIGDSKISFDLKINSIKTSLVDQNILSYTISRNDIVLGSKLLPLKESTIDSAVSIDSNETITYIIEINKNNNIENEEPYFYSNIVVSTNDLNIITEN